MTPRIATKPSQIRTNFSLGVATAAAVIALVAGSGCSTVGLPADNKTVDASSTTLPKAACAVKISDSADFNSASAVAAKVTKDMPNGSFGKLFTYLQYQQEKQEHVDRPAIQPGDKFLMPERFCVAAKQEGIETLPVS